MKSTWEELLDEREKTARLHDALVRISKLGELFAAEAISIAKKAIGAAR